MSKGCFSSLQTTRVFESRFSANMEALGRSLQQNFNAIYKRLGFAEVTRPSVAPMVFHQRMNSRTKIRKNDPHQSVTGADDRYQGLEQCDPNPDDLTYSYASGGTLARNSVSGDHDAETRLLFVLCEHIAHKMNAYLADLFLALPVFSIPAHFLSSC